jgi:hypothetical protein
MMTERDDMSGAGYPCVVECPGGIHAFLGHHLAPMCAKVCKKGLYHLVGIAKVVLIELLNVLLLNAVNDVLYTYVGDGLLKIECLLKICHVCLEAEEFVLGSVIFDGWIDRGWLNKAVGQSNGPACNSSIVNVVKNQCQLAMESDPCCCFDGDNRLRHLIHHPVHGLSCRLSYDGIERLCCHDEVDCWVDKQTSC